MSSDERDRNFDKAIARHLRSVAGSADAASSAAGSVSRRDSCADAETLAAYHERSLLPAEMNSWKEHIVGCAHCQEILAHLEATDNIPLHAAAEKLETPLTAAAGQHAATSQPARAQARRLSIVSPLRWLVPAGAIAAGLLVWIAIHENPRPVLPRSNETEMAKNQAPPAPTPSLESGAPASEAHPQLVAPTPPSLNDQIASARSRADKEPLNGRQLQNYSAKVVSPKPSAKEESKLQKDAERDSAADLIVSENQSTLDAKNSAGTMQQRAELQSQAANAQVQNQSNAYSPKTPGPAPLGQMEAAKKLKSASAPPPVPPAGLGGSPSLGVATQMVVVASDPNLIAAPGSNSLWRAGHAGLIEFSPDGGHSWSRQSSGALVDLLAGTAPSDKVCWIVGRVGAILLTTDGGAHWKLISSPLKEDLGGIQATDEFHATVWNARGTKVYTTSDGGLTWERSPKP
jgi:hypothetical protein